MIKNLKRNPLVQSLYQRFRKRNVSTDRILMGGDNGTNPNGYAKVVSSLLWTSRTILDSPHIKLLQKYKEVGQKAIEIENFQQTEYFQNAISNIEHLGHYFGCRTPEAVRDLAKRFVSSLDGPCDPQFKHSSECLSVKPIRFSNCYQLGSDLHVAALRAMTQTRCDVLVGRTAVETPLQNLLMSVLWFDGNREIYQPVDIPELSKGWPLTRKCSDRSEKISNFSNERRDSLQLKTYLDVGAFYGYFVSQMKKSGFDSSGVELDPVAVEVGETVYGLERGEVSVADTAQFLANDGSPREYDIISCLSVMHHFILGCQSVSAEEFIGILDKSARKILFFDTGEGHESWFGDRMREWTPDFIEEWLKKHTTFDEIHRLGKDEDARFPHENDYGRTLFACVRVK